MTTLGDLVQRSGRMLSGHRREAFNSLASSVDASSTTVALSRAVDLIAPNTWIGIGTELMLVDSVDSANKSLTVTRGANSTASAHAVGDQVEVGWRWFSLELLDMLGDEIASWPDEIYAVGNVDVSLGISQRDTTLPLTRFRFPLRVRRRTSPTTIGSSQWVDAPIRSYRIETNLPGYADSNAFIAASVSAAADYRIEYARALDVAGLDDLATDITAIPLSQSLVDAAIYGVAWRALSGNEANRSNDASQPEPRQADEVRSFDRMRAASSFKAIRDQRLAEEITRLHTLYPTRMT